MASEQPWLDRMRAVLQPGMRCLDVGANVGRYALLMAQHVGRTGCVVAVEPDPVAAAALREAVALAPGGDIVTVREAALADGPGRRPFYQHANDHRQNSLARENVPTSKRGSEALRTCEVDTLTLDEVLAEAPLNGQVDVVKLDTQGAEALILRGAAALLALPHVRVQLEMWPSGLAQLGTSAAEVFDRMEAAGFVPRGADDHPLAYAAMRTMATQRESGRGYFNLLFVK